MALASAVAGSLRPSQVITWTRSDDTAENLTGATLTGQIFSTITGARSITGTLTVTTAASGVFTWAYSAADVETAGKYLVQFTATFGSSPTPARTLATDWYVSDAIS